MALINEEKIQSLYSFNPNPKNFNTPKNKLNFQHTLINYNNEKKF